MGYELPIILILEMKVTMNIMVSRREILSIIK